MAGSKDNSNKSEDGNYLSELEDDFGDDIEVEAEFVGREKDRQMLNTAWKTHKVFGIFGLKSVGKSRLVKEFLSRKKTNGFILIHIDMKLMSDTKSLYANICAALQIVPEVQDTKSDGWIQHICGSLKTTNGKYFIFFFDNTEDYQEFKGVNVRDSFLSLCTSLVRQCNHVKIFVTSTTLVQLSQLRRWYFSHEVLPLSKSDTRHLLKYLTEGIDLGEYEHAIVDLSEGMPLLIFMIGSELKVDGGMVTPKDMVDFLLTFRLRALSREYYPEEDRVADVYKKFIDRLDGAYKRRLTILDFIPASFTADQAKNLLGFKTVAAVKDQALIHIRRRHVLNFDPKTGRYNIQGILRECVKTFYTIKCIPEIRARYCQIFSEVMQDISGRLGTEEYTHALAAFAVEQPNLQKLLTEVKYTRQETYHFFIEIATKCTDLIEKFMAGDGEDFYKGCLRAADMYGKEQDRATVNLAVGSMYTNTKGCLKKGEDNYYFALQVLENQGRSLQLATAYQKIGWNMLQQGRNHDANRFFKKSLDISLVSGEEYQLVSFQSMSNMGVSLTQLGRFEEAERYHFESLKRRKEIQGEDHPFVGAVLNNIGIMYYQEGDSLKALKFYEEGLVIKSKAKASGSSVASSLSNTANMYSETGDSKTAHKLLDEALELLAREKVPQRHTIALIHDTKGKAYRREGDFQSAEDMFQKAVDIRSEISKENVPYLESLVHLANIHKHQGNYESCVRISKKALKIKENAEIAMPQHPFIKECLECLAEVYQSTDDRDKYIETLEKLQSELFRLEQVHLDHGNDRDLKKVRNQMCEVNDELSNIDRTKKNIYNRKP